MKYIYWSVSEKLSVFRNYEKLMLDKQSRNLGVADSWICAQEILHPSRRRKVSGANGARIMAEYGIWVKMGRDVRYVHGKVTTLPAVTPAVTPQVIQPGPLVTPGHTYTHAADIVRLERKLDTLMDLVRDLHKVWVEVPCVKHDVNVQSLPQSQVATERARRVYLVNANEVQRSQVQEAFPELEVLACEGRVPGGIQPFLVLGFTKFMGHDLEKACIKKFGAKYQRVAGAASDAVRVLGGLIGALNGKADTLINGKL